MRAEVKRHNGTPTLFLNGAPAYANFNLLSPFDGDYRTPSWPVARKLGRPGSHRNRAHHPGRLRATAVHKRILPRVSTP
jgi:hypothetical protein